MRHYSHLDVLLQLEWWPSLWQSLQVCWQSWLQSAYQHHCQLSSCIALSSSPCLCFEMCKSCWRICKHLNRYMDSNEQSIQCLHHIWQWIQMSCYSKVSHSRHLLVACLMCLHSRFGLEWNAVGLWIGMSSSSWILSLIWLFGNRQCWSILAANLC